MTKIDHPDGSVEYKFPHPCTDILLNGESIAQYEVIEIRTWTNNWGYVASLQEIPTGTVKVQVDGMRRVYTRHGELTIIP